MAAAPMIIGGVSSIAGMAGAQVESAQKQQASNYNAAMKMQQAEGAVAQANEDARRVRVQGKQALGGIKAAVGASGIQMDASALDVLETSASNNELDALTVKHSGEMKAWAYKAGAKLDLLESENTRVKGNLASANYLLQGISSGVENYGKMKTAQAEAQAKGGS